LQAVEKIFGYLDGKSRTTLRLVCHTWKKIIDDDVGLFVRIDDRENGNPDFVRLVRIERVVLGNVDRYEKYIVPKFPEALKMLSGIGPVPSAWFRDKVLSKCQGLTRIELSGRFLFSQDLCECDASKGKADPLILLNLKTFIIFIDIGVCQEYLHERKPQGKLQVVWGALVGCRFQDVYFMRETADTNLTFLLNTIRSPQLSLFYLFVDPMHFEEPTNNFVFEFKKDPLEVFLEYHRNTLKHLYLPSFETNSREVQSFRIFPETLKTLEISIVQKGRHKKYSFSEKILTEQTVLEELRLEKSYIGEFKNGDIPHLGVLLIRNEQTLRYVNLTVSAPDHELLNGTLFKNCTHLTNLILEDSPHRLEFYNFSALPKGLKTLRIVPSLVLKSEDKHVMADFCQLETLQLIDIQLQSPSTLQRHDFLIHFIKSLFRLRRLSALFLNFAPTESPTYSKILNSMIVTVSGLDIHSTEEFHSLEVYGKHQCFPRPLPHFLDSCPFNREVVDPLREARTPAFDSNNNADSDYAALSDIVFNSNVLRRTAGARRAENTGNTLYDLCAGIYMLDTDD
jgi:hypothetical protein